MTDTLPNLLQRFFHQWLAEQRNASRHTILAYRDAWRLFLRFVADRTCRPVAKLTLNHLTAAEVAAFLQHVETGRGASIATRNCRLAALKRDEPIFCNRYGHKLGASGVRFQLHQYVNSASEKMPNLSAKRISPHTFRHTTAVHLIASGVDVTVIRSWLGHAQLDTTNHYAQANLQTKREALEHVASRARPSKPLRWKRDQDLPAWLDSL